MAALVACQASDMSVPTSGNSGSLQAEVLTIKMDINDDDEDVIVANVSITNEAPVPMGGLDVSVITNTGQKFPSIEGVTSLGPGVQRDWTFEFPLDSGEWTFVLRGSSDEIKMGPYAFDFEYSVTQGRKLASNIGSSLFSGAFDNHLGDFGNIKEREMIDPTKVQMTSYAAENSLGGETLIKTDLAELSTGLTATSSQGALDAPILNSNPVREAPLPQPSRSEDPLLAHVRSSPSVRDYAALEPASENVALPSVSPSATPLTPLNSVVSPPTPPSGPTTPSLSPPSSPPSPPKPPSGPTTPPPTPPKNPPTGPPAGPPSPPKGPPGPPSPPSGPSAGPPSPPTSPPSGPPAGPPSPPKGPLGPPSGPPSPPTGPPSGPPAGPPAGPPTSPPAKPEMQESTDL